jgi:hypothetical protein
LGPFLHFPGKPENPFPPSCPLVTPPASFSFFSFCFFIYKNTHTPIIIKRTITTTIATIALMGRPLEAFAAALPPFARAEAVLRPLDEVPVTPFARVPVAEEALEVVRADVVFAVVARVVLTTAVVAVTAWAVVVVVIAHQDDGMNAKRERIVKRNSNENVNILTFNERMC